MNQFQREQQAKRMKRYLSANEGIIWLNIMACIAVGRAWHIHSV